MSQFWVLGQPDAPDARKRMAEWDQVELQYEKILCPIYPTEHSGAGSRISPLSIILPNLKPAEFVWAYWDCAVQESVLRLFRDAGFKGCDFVTAKVKFADLHRPAPQFWELIARGSAGVASAESGYRVLKVCPGCGFTCDTKIEDPTRIVDESRWDGSDFFRIHPITTWIFITERVVDVLRSSGFKGWKAYSLAEKKEELDIAVPGYPGKAAGSCPL